MIAPEFYFQADDKEESSWTRFHFNKRRQPGTDTKRQRKRAKVDPEQHRPANVIEHNHRTEVSEELSFGHITGDAPKTKQKHESRRTQVQKALEEGATTDPWTKAMGQARGEKQFDDPKLLKKSQKAEESRKRKSTREWDARIAAQQKSKDERQAKRKTNIANRRARPGFEGAKKKRKFKK